MNLSLKPFMQRHALACYFTLAYGITWLSITGLLATYGFQLGTITTPAKLLMVLLMLLGPSLASLTMHALTAGRAGLRDLWQRQTHGRAGWRGYALALLTVPLLCLVILTALSRLVSPAYAPGFQVFGIAAGLLAGSLEELGWSGFATPRLLQRYSPLKAGLILGLVWAAWHLLADFSSNFSTMGANWGLWFVLFWLLPLTAYRILMTWVYARARSLPLAQVMHASYTGWLACVSPAVSFEQGLIWQALFALGLWGVVAAVVTVTRPTGQKLSIKSAAG